MKVKLYRVYAIKNNNHKLIDFTADPADNYKIKYPDCKIKIEIINVHANEFKYPDEFIFI